jgi:hypothetical protein
MTTKSFSILLFLFLLSLYSSAQIKPTGTYILGKGLNDRNNSQKGNRGEIRVKKVEANKIAIAVYAINGYDSGDFIDTLTLKNNQAIYSNARFDSSCRIYLKFTPAKLIVKQTSKVHPSPCGFGWNADISGVYKKVSDKLPVIRDITKED